jgi:hypothetical protein
MKLVNSHVFRNSGIFIAETYPKCEVGELRSLTFSSKDIYYKGMHAYMYQFMYLYYKETARRNLRRILLLRTLISHKPPLINMCTEL